MVTMVLSLCRLTKDPNRWGVVEEGNSVSVFYVLHPPWHNARPDIPEELLGPIPPWDKPPHVRSIICFHGV